MHSFKSTLLATACAAFGLLAVNAQATVVKGGTEGANVQASPGMMLVPSGSGFAVQVPKTDAVPTGGNGINYHGGATMVAGPKVYYIWYGDAWATDTGTTILTDLMNSTGGSPHFNINTTYFEGKVNKKGKVKKPKYIANVVTLLGQTSVTSASGSKWHGTTLTDAMIKTIVTEAIADGTLPSDTSALYFVLTDKNVKESGGFCSQFCGWHGNASILGADIKYSFVGNAGTQCPSGCISGNIKTKSPNDNLGADGMASVIMHELEEATTDPDVSGGGGLKYGWYDDATGGENGDKCAWTFGTLYTAPNGAKANVKLGARDYLIQQNWVNAGGGFCAMSH